MVTVRWISPLIIAVWWMWNETGMVNMNQDERDRPT